MYHINKTSLITWVNEGRCALPPSWSDPHLHLSLTLWHNGNGFHRDPNPLLIFSAVHISLPPSSDTCWLSLTLCSSIWTLESAYQVSSYQATAVIKYKIVSHCNRSNTQICLAYLMLAVFLWSWIILSKWLTPVSTLIMTTSALNSLRHPAPHIWVRHESLQGFVCFYHCETSWLTDFLLPKLTFLKGL